MIEQVNAIFPSPNEKRRKMNHQNNAETDLNPPQASSSSSPLPISLGDQQHVLNIYFDKSILNNQKIHHEYNNYDNNNGGSGEFNIIPDYSLFSDDTVFYMMQFIESTFLIQVCTRVCRAWYEKAMQIPISFYFNVKKLYLGGLKDMIERDYLMLKNLTMLNLGDNVIGNEGMKCLVECERLGNLTHLEIFKNRIGSDGFRHLCEGKIIRKLRKLNLASNILDDLSLKFLSESVNFNNLTLLNLGNNRITSKGIEYLVQTRETTDDGPQFFNPKTLLRLTLAANRIDGQGSKLISQYMPNLIRLDVRMNKIKANESIILRSELVNLKEYYHC